MIVRVQSRSARLHPLELHDRGAGRDQRDPEIGHRRRRRAQPRLAVRGDRPGAHAGGGRRLVGAVREVNGLHRSPTPVRMDPGRKP